MMRFLFLACLLPAAALSIACTAGRTASDWARAYWLIATGRSGP